MTKIKRTAFSRVISPDEKAIFNYPMTRPFLISALLFLFAEVLNGICNVNKEEERRRKGKISTPIFFQTIFFLI